MRARRGLNAEPVAGNLAAIDAEHLRRSGRVASSKLMTQPHPTVLIVDDNDDIREGLATYISRQGYNVETASDGAEALSKMRSAHPGLVILDLAMPGMTGMGFRTLQVANPDLGQIPVVVYSALGGAREIADAMGAAAFVEKPVAMRDLMVLVHRHCLK